MNSKPRSDAKLLNLPPEDIEKLRDALIGGMKYDDACEFADKEFGVRASRTTFCEFWKKECFSIVSTPNGIANKFHDLWTRSRNYSKHRVALADAAVLGLPTNVEELRSGLAHQKTFEVIASGEARKISEVFQRQFDSAILDAQFSGCPHLAYFEFAGNEDPAAAEVIDQVLKLSQTGFESDPAQITEKTGYRLTRAAGLLGRARSGSFGLVRANSG